MRWLTEHGEEERVGMVREVVRRWEEQHGGDGVEAEVDEKEREGVELLKKVLERSS